MKKRKQKKKKKQQPGNQNQRASFHKSDMEAAQMKMVSVTLGAKRDTEETKRPPACLSGGGLIHHRLQRGVMDVMLLWL